MMPELKLVKKTCYMMLDPFKEKNIPLGAGKSSMCSIALGQRTHRAVPSISWKIFWSNDFSDIK